ncbi:MAG: hypothetical protein KDK90_17790 [Leptospiraceae bacterium]|nr:hypothetical protein [Leptospiraceae bacterium]
MKQFLKLFLALFVISMLVVACKSGDDYNDKVKDDTKTLLLLYIADQSGGACAQVTQSTKYNTSTGKYGPLYTATGYSIPKGGCNWETINGPYYRSSSDAATALSNRYDKYITIYNAAGSNCSDLATYFTTLKSTYTSSYLDSTAASSGCLTTTYESVTYCQSRADEEQLEYNTKYIGISSTAGTMATNLTYKKALLTSNQSTNGFSSSQISNLRTMSSGELTTYKSNAEGAAALWAYTAYINRALGGTTYGSSSATTYASCVSDILNSYSSLKNIWVASTGVSSTLGFTSSDVSGISDTLTSSLNCYYGNGYDSSSTGGDQTTISGTTLNIYGKCSGLPEY